MCHLPSDGRTWTINLKSIGKSSDVYRKKETLDILRSPLENIIHKTIEGVAPAKCGYLYQIVKKL
jgi:hypothetical protein